MFNLCTPEKKYSKKWNSTISKRKKEKQTDEVTGWLQISPIKIQDLNDQYNIEMFTTSIRGGKAFVAEQNIRELKTRAAKLHIQKLKISPTKITLNPTVNMNSVDSEKYGINHEELKKRSLTHETFKTLFNFYTIEKLDWTAMTKRKTSFKKKN